MILATVTTGNYEFRTIATTEDDARAQLLAAWTRHARATGADHDLMAGLIAADDINFLPLILGATYRDDSPI